MAWPGGIESSDEREAKTRYAYSWAPAARSLDNPAEQESLLEQRLAAFALKVERARNYGEVPPPLFLDGDALAADLQRIIADIEDEAHVAVHVRDLISGKPVFDHYGDTFLNAASNQKIVTTSAALDLLGPEYVFETSILYADGRLYIRGEGDPTLVEDGLGVLIRSALEELDGDPIEAIVVDDSAFSDAQLAPGFDREGVGVSYQAPSGALSLNFNTVEVIVYPVRGSSRPAVKLVPESTRVRVINTARTSSRGGLYVKTRPARDEMGVLTEVLVSGRIPKTGVARVVRRRVVDPGLYCGGAVAWMVATQRGGEAPPVERGVVPDDAIEVAYRSSPPLLEVTGRVLAYSNNFIAEQLLRTLGWRLTGDPGDWDNGSEVLAGYWSALGQSMDDIRFQNGSGLSEEGRISAQALVDLIAVAGRGQSRGGSVLDALPLAGEEGTLRARLRKSGKRVRAKTGTLDGVSALSGIVTAEDGTPQVAFSIISNVREGETLVSKRRKRVEDQLVLALLAHLDDWELRWAVDILEAEDARPDAMTGAMPDEKVVGEMKSNQLG